ncbi:MAG: hypothetical protein JWN61_465 [Pseudonocardiales bacterium]|nr:hypothetical protein [Pseudonocardiales bacterium]
MLATRYRANGTVLADRLSPPYDVIDAAGRSALLAGDESNIVGLILPEIGSDGRPDYPGAAARLRSDLAQGILSADDQPALYVYEMATADGRATRGLLGAVRLHEAADGVIFPHENTMDGPVADRLALMEATQANLEPIYLIYDGGGPATDTVARVAQEEPLAVADLPDGSRHRLWRIIDRAVLDQIEGDLAERTAVIADGHHRYATYLELQRRTDAQRGPGPWDRGLALLVDSTAFGPQVEAIHRVVPDLSFAEAIRQSQPGFSAEPLASWAGDVAIDLSDDQYGLYVASLVDALPGPAGAFAVVITDGFSAALLSISEIKMDPESETCASEDQRDIAGATGPAALLAGLDVSRVHGDLVAGSFHRADTAEALLYAHSATEAIAAARATRGVAILLRPTPVEAVLAIARAGLRMPRKSTLFLPKPASGMALRLFDDQPAER